MKKIQDKKWLLQKHRKKQSHTGKKNIPKNYVQVHV